MSLMNETDSIRLPVSADAAPLPASAAVKATNEAEAAAPPQVARGEAAAPTQGASGVATAPPPRSVLSGAAASSVASHPISPSPVVAVLAFPGQTYGVKATNEAEAAAPPQVAPGEAAAPTQAASGVATAPPPCSVLSGAAASFLASNHISPYPVSAVSTKLSCATPGHTDGVKATNEAEAAAPPQAVRGVATAPPPRFVLSGAAASFAICGPSPSLGTAVSPKAAPTSKKKKKKSGRKTDGETGNSKRALRVKMPKTTPGNTPLHTPLPALPPCFGRVLVPARSSEHLVLLFLLFR